MDETELITFKRLVLWQNGGNKHLEWQEANADLSYWHNVWDTGETLSYNVPVYIKPVTEDEPDAEYPKFVVSTDPALWTETAFVRIDCPDDQDNAIVFYRDGSSNSMTWDIKCDKHIHEGKWMYVTAQQAHERYQSIR